MERGRIIGDGTTMMSKLVPDWDIRDLILSTWRRRCLPLLPVRQVHGGVSLVARRAVMFPVYQIPQSVKLGAILASEDPDAIEHEVDEVYRCVGCEACRTRCPHEVGTGRHHAGHPQDPGRVRLLPLRAQGRGLPHPELGQPIRRTEGKPNGLAERATGAGVLRRHGVRLRAVLRAGVRPAGEEGGTGHREILQRAGVTFGLLGNRESCCGESIRRVGAEDVFQETAGANVAAFNDAGVDNVLVTIAPLLYDLLPGVRRARAQLRKSCTRPSSSPA